MDSDVCPRRYVCLHYLYGRRVAAATPASGRVCGEPAAYAANVWGAHSECVFPSRWDRVGAQSAPFRRVRLSSPGQTRRRLTEKRSLGRATHVKAHSVRRISRKGALCMRVVTQTAPFRHVARPPFWLLREKRSKSALPVEKPSYLQRDFLSFGGRLWARFWVRSARAVSRCRRNAYRSKGRPDLHCQTP